MNNFSTHKGTIKYFETGRGLAYTATLFLNGNNIGTIENEGCGGDTHARISGSNQGLLYTEAKDACAESMECVSEYLETLMNRAEGI